MFHIRRLIAAALLVGAAMGPALTAAPAYAIGSSSASVPAAAAGWRLVRTYPSRAACQAAGPGVAAGHRWQCSPSPSVPSAYDLYVFS
jgi:hypothetical protein